MSKKITHAQMVNRAKQLGVPVAMLYAVQEVEAKSDGFLPTGAPLILFERHYMWRGLGERQLYKLQSKMNKERPDLCQPKWGGYGTTASQHKRLDDAVAYHRETALESASWGLGQVMGANWKALKYPSLQAFINAMYADEDQQMDAMCRFIKYNNLVSAMLSRNWNRFARVYNGPAYAENHYHTKLAAAYARWVSKYPT